MRRIVHGVRRPHAYAGVLVALSLMCAGGPAATADTVSATASTEVVVKRGHRGPAVRKIQSRLGIPADGVFGPQTGSAVRRFQRAKGLVVDGIVGPQTRRSLGLEPFSRSSVHRSRRSSGAGGRAGDSDGSGRVPAILEAIARCESGANPRAVSPNGLYRGKYQFSQGTWKGLGGKGDPAKAPEWKQDRLALELYRRSGNAPWPNCP